MVFWTDASAHTHKTCHMSHVTVPCIIPDPSLLAVAAAAAAIFALHQSQTDNHARGPPLCCFSCIGALVCLLLLEMRLDLFCARDLWSSTSVVLGW